MWFLKSWKGGGLASNVDPAGLKVDKHTAVCIHCKLIGNRGGWWWIRTALDVENRNQDPVTVTKDVPWEKTCDVQSSSSHTNCFQSPADQICLKPLWRATLMLQHIEPCVLTGLGPQWNYGNYNLCAFLFSFWCLGIIYDDMLWMQMQRVTSKLFFKCLQVRFCSDIMHFKPKYQVPISNITVRAGFAANKTTHPLCTCVQRSHQTESEHIQIQ